MDTNKKIIDIEDVIKKKSPRLLKVLPGFLLRYLKKILHEKDVNDFISKHRDDDPITFCNAVIEMFNIKIDCEGLDNIPKEGGAVLTINHPWGGMDAMALVTILQKKRSDIKFVVNDILLFLENLKPIFVGVNKLGKNAVNSLKEVENTFAGNELLCIFPAGLVSRKVKGKVRDLDWKKTFVTRSIKYQKTIIPVHINGELTNFFYRLSNLRKFFRIKANIEMLYLVNELYKQNNKKIKIIFGKPIQASSFDASKTKQEWANYVKNEVYKLADK